MLRTDAQVTQMMDCRSPDASQCFNMPDGAVWAEGREAARQVTEGGKSLLQVLREMAENLAQMLRDLQAAAALEESTPRGQLLQAEETMHMAAERWSTLKRDFFDKEQDEFHVSKVARTGTVRVPS